MEVEKKFWNETKMSSENYFDSRKRHIMDQFEEHYKLEIKNIELKERLNFQQQSQKMLEEFNKILLEELNTLEKKLRKEQEQALEKQRTMMKGNWKQAFKGEIDKTVQNMTNQFINELDRQRAILTSNFKLELQKARLQRSYDINLEKTRCQDSLRQLRHHLECTNIANMMYVLCMERRKCCAEKTTIENQYTDEIKKLNDVISDQDTQIKTLTEERNKEMAEVNLRETCLLEIIRQFQKFINFALKAAPTQAEFLLSVEKMMAFELTNAILKSDCTRLKYCKEILPWTYHERHAEDAKPPGLVLNDHHNCLKELTPRARDGTSTELPAFYYKDRLYVREDFRNMISQGTEIRQSNELWSKDVEILIEMLRKSVSEKDVTEQPTNKS